MKKTYIMPETEVVMLNTTKALLIASPGFGGGGSGGAGDAPELPGADLPDLPTGDKDEIMNMLFN